MTLLIVGNEKQFGECRQKFNAAHELLWAPRLESHTEELQRSQAVFDFTASDAPASLLHYVSFPSVPVFVHNVNSTLHTLLNHAPATLKHHIYGFNGLLTCIHRSIMEVSVTSPDALERLKETTLALGTDYEVVQDCVGMVTPRVLAMIINEAYLTTEEGTASREDIDLAMRLGTNYPFGPFEWAQRIGLKNIASLLDALHKETKDERYKVSKLLESEAAILMD